MLNVRASIRRVPLSWLAANVTGLVYSSQESRAARVPAVYNAGADRAAERAAAHSKELSLRIGIDYTAAIKQTAGIGRYVRGLTEGLARVDMDNEYLLFYAAHRRPLGAAPLMSERPNFRERALPVSEKMLNALWHRLALPVPVDLFIRGIDVFHFPDFTLPPVRQAATVLTVHDLSFLMYPECADEGLRAYLEHAVPQSLARADFVLADSENTRNDLICLLDVPPERAEVVYCGVDAHFRPAEEDALLPVRQRYDLDFPFIFTVGVLEPRKNLATLLRALSILKGRRGFRHRLVVAGKPGWLYESIHRQVEALELERDVIFLGHVPDDDLPALYSLADVLAYPSLYEGFGLPPLEAMACGTPVVCSDASSLPEVVGEAALKVKAMDADGLANALSQVLEDEELKQTLRLRGRQRAALFSWEAAARKLLDVYSRVYTMR